MVVIRYEGPRGAPGMPELLDPTSRITALCRQRHITIALMTDARFSGGSVGLVIGHVAPEALLGGPIALVEDGDTIVVDLNADRLDCVELDDPDAVGAAGRGLAGGGRGQRRRPPGRGAGDGPGAGPDAGHGAARPPRRRHGDTVADLTRAIAVRRAGRAPPGAGDRKAGLSPGGRPCHNGRSCRHAAPVPRFWYSLRRRAPTSQPRASRPPAGGSFQFPDRFNRHSQHSGTGETT